MEFVKLKGIVLRETKKGEYDKLLTVLTAEEGRITVSAKGARSQKNRNLPSCKLFAYSEFVLYKKAGDMYILKEAALIEGFFDLVSDVALFSLGSYFLDLASEVTYPGRDESAVLRLLLTALYTLTSHPEREEIVKPAYEMRICALLGVFPSVGKCSRCGKKPEGDAYLDVSNGVLICPDCVGLPGERTDGEYASGVLCAVNGSVRSAMLYAASAPLERLFAFSLKGDSGASFFEISEKYLLYRLGKKPKTLEMYGQFRKSEK